MDEDLGVLPRLAQAESGEKRRSVNPVEGRGKMTEKRSETRGRRFDPGQLHQVIFSFSPLTSF